jgi:hypothetical protein
MAGYRLGRRDVHNSEKIEAFISGLNKLFGRIQTLDDWRKIVLAENFRALGYFGDVLLGDYLKDVKRKLDKSKAFDGLANFFLRPVKETGKN